KDRLRMFASPPHLLYCQRTHQAAPYAVDVHCDAEPFDFESVLQSKSPRRFNVSQQSGVWIPDRQTVAFAQNQLAGSTLLPHGGIVCIGPITYFQVTQLCRSTI